MGEGGGAQQLQCKSELAQCSENSIANVRGGGGNGGLIFEKKCCKKKKSSPHLRKKLGMGSPVFCTFSFTPTQ